MFSQKDYTVFSVDWREGSCDENLPKRYLLPAYPKAASNTRKTGELLAKYILDLDIKKKHIETNYKYKIIHFYNIYSV